MDSKSPKPEKNELDKEFGKNRGQAMGNEFMASLWPGTVNDQQPVPEWVQKAYSQLAKTTFPVAYNNPDYRSSPFVHGQVLAVTHLLIRRMSETNTFDFDPDELRLVREAWDAMSRNIQEEISNILQYEPEKTAEFFRGFSRVLDQSIRSEDGILGTAATETYMLLITCWPEVQKFKTLAELHRWLESFIKPGQFPNFVRFSKLCQRIGLKLGKKGRPRKKK